MSSSASRRQSGATATRTLPSSGRAMGQQRCWRRNSRERPSASVRGGGAEGSVTPAAKASGAPRGVIVVSRWWLGSCAYRGTDRVGGKVWQLQWESVAGRCGATVTGERRGHATAGVAFTGKGGSRACYRSFSVRWPACVEDVSVVVDHQARRAPVWLELHAEGTGREWSLRRT
jgi:hypothetical protein